MRNLPLALAALLLLGCDTPTHPKLKDPCYSPTIHVDTLTMTADSITWEWTPGRCS